MHKQTFSVAIMSDYDASGASAAPQEPPSLSLAQTTLFSWLLSVLKRDIVLVQPGNVPTGAEQAPLVLPYGYPAAGSNAKAPEERLAESEVARGLLDVARED
ncbi:hypothetical protein C8F04DRAFT_1390261 [Mycena alexandri]|uniref:Uncharacterized protein n=1 Tax=Mycena alexandri TaxID=1745969 RepID=A0AAD6TD03_9AGAR|nr:hypothetical protein C8F04DRAFT_1390261 [Mycena alexandri]